jgi:DNA-directed RNA polymerase subunit RPC12/RpoP
VRKLFEPNQIKKRCITCGKEFSIKESHANRYHNCSFKCRTIARMAKSMKTAVLAAEKERFTPAESAKIRSEIAKAVKIHIAAASEVLAGNVNWNPTQARVFGILLNKVVPDLNATYVQHEHNTRQLVDLSREELERIAAGLDVIDVETTNESSEPTSSSPEVEHDDGGTWEGDESTEPERDSSPQTGRSDP